jgi:hypothetical protein
MGVVLSTVSIFLMLDYRFCTGHEEGIAIWNPVLEKKNLDFYFA